MTIAQDDSRRIVVLGTGGTIAGVAQADGGYRAGQLTVETALARALGTPTPLAVRSIALDPIDVTALPGQAHTPATWSLIADAVRDAARRKDICGIVVLTGTDTLEELAYMLRLTVASTVPIAITGSMLPGDAPGSDAGENVQSAIAYAQNPDSPVGVAVVLDQRIYPARGIAKLATRFPGAFGMPATHSGLALAQRSTRAGYRHGAESEFAALDLTALPRVDILYGYAGDPSPLAQAAHAAGAKGLVVAGVGGGNMHPRLEETLHEFQRTGGLHVVRASRIPGATVLPGAEFTDADPCIPAGDLSPAQARVLLTLALAAGVPSADTRRVFAEY